MSTLTEVGADAFLMGNAEINDLLGPDLNDFLGVDPKVDLLAEDFANVALDKPRTAEAKSLEGRASEPKKGVFTQKNILKVAAIAGLVLVGGAVVLGLLAVLPFVWAIPLVLMNGIALGTFFSTLTLGMYAFMQFVTLSTLALVIGVLACSPVRPGSQVGIGAGNAFIGGALTLANAR